MNCTQFMDMLNMLTYSPAHGDQSGCLGEESVNVGEALVPQMDGHVHHVGDQAEGRKRRVQEQGVQTTTVEFIYTHVSGTQ